MKLDMQAGLGGIVLEGPSTPHSKWGHSSPPPTFWPLYCGQTAGWMKMPLSAEVNRGPENTVRSPHKRGTAAHLFSIHVYCGRLDGSRFHLVRRYASAQATLYTPNPIIFIAILPTLQTLSSNHHSALLSSPDFHAVIAVHGNYCSTSSYMLSLLAGSY